jgi:hypothetical protein
LPRIYKLIINLSIQGLSINYLILQSLLMCESLLYALVSNFVWFMI